MHRRVQRSLYHDLETQVTLGIGCLALCLYDACVSPEYNLGWTLTRAWLSNTQGEFHL